MEGRAGSSIGRKEGANHSSHGQQMNDAGNQYLGAGVEIRAVVAAVASLAAQEAWSSLGGMRRKQECGATSFPLHILPPPPLILLSSPSPPPLYCISLWLGSGTASQEIPHPEKTGDLVSETLGLSVLEEPCPVPTCPWTPEPN